MNNATQHYPMLPELLRQCPGINTRDRWYFVMLEPIPKRTHRSLVAVVFAGLGHNDAADMDGLALEILGKAVGIFFLRWDAVVADERIREYQNLPTVARIREALGVAGHARIEHHFTVTIDRGTEGFTFEDCSIGEDEGSRHRGQGSERK